MGIYRRDGVIHRDLVFTSENIGHKILNKIEGETRRNNTRRADKPETSKTRWGEKSSEDCTLAVHQTGAVTLDLSHFLQQLIEVFLNDDSCGMGITQSLPGTIYGFAIE